MKTFEMVELANQNGMTYIVGDMMYQKDKGFFDKRGEEWGATAWAGTNGLQRFIMCDNWKLVDISVPFMEACEAFRDGKDIMVEFPSALNGKTIKKIFKQADMEDFGVMREDDEVTFYTIYTGKWFILD